MASLDSLNDGQRAILQLLLRQNKSYQDLAGLLKTDAAGVRSRAHDAVAAVGPEARDISVDHRNEIADYLLGQQTASQRAATREYLQSSSAGSAWARAAVTALEPIGGDRLPDIPAAREEVAEAFDALDRRTAHREKVKRSSQLGTKLLLAGVGVILGVAIILALSLGGDDKDDPGTAATTPATTSTPLQTTPTGDKFEVVAQGVLAPPKGSGDSGAKGQVAIVRFPDNNQFRFAMDASGLRPSSASGSAYGVWLYTSDDKKLFLGFPDTTVGKDGKLRTVSDLSPNTPNYAAVLLTRETAEKPTKPGTIVLIGRMVTAAEQAQAQQQQTQTQTQAQTTTTP